jgi:regulatory protein
LEIPEYILSFKDSGAISGAAENPQDTSADDKTLFKKVYESALRLILHAEQTSKSLSQKLIKKGFDKVLIEKALDILREQNYLNDERFAALYIEAHIRRKSESPRNLLASAIRRGIDSRLAKEKLHTILVLETEVELISKWRKAKPKKAPPDSTDRELKRILKMEGFSSDAIEEYLANE